MPVSQKYRCIFVHIPKCAGTSIEAALDMHGGIASIGIEPYLNQMENSDTLFGAGAQHYTIKDIQQRLEPDVFQGYFKFSFVRNPWDRFVSYVAWKADESGKLKWIRNAEPTLAEFYNVLWRLLCDRAFGRSVHPHLVPQIDYIFDSNGKLGVDFVGRVENLEVDWKEVCNRIGVDAPLEKRMKSNHKPYTDYYNPITRLLIWLVYRRDIKQFGYSYR